MTFFCDTPAGRIAQAEETLSDLGRIREGETHDRATHHLDLAIGELESAVALMRAYDIARRDRRGEQS